MRPWTSEIVSLPFNRHAILQKNLPAIHDFALISGLLYKFSEQLPGQTKPFEYCDNVPLNLVPKRYSKKEVQHLIDVQKHWGYLIDTMARDFEWYTTQLK